MTRGGDDAEPLDADDLQADSNVAAIFLNLLAAPGSDHVLATVTVKALQRQADRQRLVRLEEE